MDLTKIKTLLEKYYNGETTLEEEKILQEYFNQDVIDEELQADKDIFMYNNIEKENLNNIPDISDELLDTLQNLNEYKVDRNKKLIYWTLRAAAGVLVLIASFFLIKDEIIDKHNKFQAVDTYQNPEEAYKQAKQTLLYVSELLNSGTEHLEPISKLDEGKDKLNPLSTFNDGLKELSPIEKYKIANKYIKE